MLRVGVLNAEREFEIERSRPGTKEIEHSLERQEKTSEAVIQALESHGIQTIEIPVSYDFFGHLLNSQVDLIFNTYFGPARRQDQAHAASLMSFAQVHYTGGNFACHLLGLNKLLTKKIFITNGIPTPNFIEYSMEGDDALSHVSKKNEEYNLRFPVIVKAVLEGEGIGLDERSIIYSPEELMQAVKRIFNDYHQPALAEEYIAGREFTVGVLVKKRPEVLPIMEIVLGTHKISSYQVKTEGKATELCPAPIEDRLSDSLCVLAVKAGEVIGCRDYWRVDFRVTEDGEPFILEVNTLPGLQPDYSDFPKMAAKAGISYTSLIRSIIESALKRVRKP